MPTAWYRKRAASAAARLVPDLNEYARCEALIRSNKIYPATATRLGGFCRSKRRSLSQRAPQPQSEFIAVRYIDSGRAADDDDCGEADA